MHWHDQPPEHYLLQLSTVCVPGSVRRKGNADEVAACLGHVLGRIAEAREHTLRWQSTRDCFVERRHLITHLLQQRRC